MAPGLIPFFFKGLYWCSLIHTNKLHTKSHHCSIIKYFWIRGDLGGGEDDIFQNRNHSTLVLYHSTLIQMNSLHMKCHHHSCLLRQWVLWWKERSSDQFTENEGVLWVARMSTFWRRWIVLIVPTTIIEITAVRFWRKLLPSMEQNTKMTVILFLISSLVFMGITLRKTSCCWHIVTLLL